VAVLINFSNRLYSGSFTPAALLRQLHPAGLRRHVRGIPLGPVCILLPDAFLMLAVGCRRTSHGAGHVTYRAERSRTGVNEPGKPCGDLLQNPMSIFATTGSIFCWVPV
jgi:hypothetical protein